MRNLSLESLLQQAWLQSHKPKVQRRIASAAAAAAAADVSLERRGGSSSSRTPEKPEKLLFHKKSTTSTVFLSRFVLPQLNCYSTKTDIPRSVFTLPWNSPTLSIESGTSTLFSGVTESGDSSSCSVDFEGGGGGETPRPALVSYLDAILMDEEEEKQHETSAYQAMAKEISDLIGLESPTSTPCEDDVVCFESCWKDRDCCLVEKTMAYQAMTKEISDLISPSSDSSEVSDAMIRVRMDSLPTEESAVRMIMEAYACILSKHIADLSINFDHRETDTILIHVDEEWKSYLQSLNQNFKPASNFDFNRLLCGAGKSKAGSGLASSSACGSLTELLYR